MFGGCQIVKLEKAGKLCDQSVQSIYGYIVSNASRIYLSRTQSITKLARAGFPGSNNNYTTDKIALKNTLDLFHQKSLGVVFRQVHCITQNDLEMFEVKVH